MNRSSLVVASFALGLALPARAGVGFNGVQMNGVQMNGVQMNGVQMNGVQMNGNMSPDASMSLPGGDSDWPRTGYRIGDYSSQGLIQ